MFGLFGGSKKKKEQPKEEAPKPLSQDHIQKEKLLNDLNVFIDKQDEKITLFEGKIEKIEDHCKQLIMQKKKKQAMKKFQEQKEYLKYIEKLENQRQAMNKIKIRVETCSDDAEALSIMKNANQMLKQQESINEDMQEQLMDLQEIEQNTEQTNELWKQMAGQEEEDEDFNAFEAEILGQQLDGMQQPNINQAEVQQQKQQQQQQQTQQQTQPQQQQKQSNMEAALDGLLN
ncbi:hypothetical protein PPERSA_00696 [Pseudocohnilembus persalinus]|uniref:Snf7-domain-containing protein n=1 Tax=Pseudocohnilembus persalinus TaxID=266149 RepID=A0A0V0QST0_PSEPJ|nr:hypothetical protein PPERSA_00696 [Pseudocohnilembus persalinus]|eukprot:KRX05395.1 hypothetical protein PPERSA_00696 [Pseudocohnilembus persalinus]